MRLRTSLAPRSALGVANRRRSYKAAHCQVLSGDFPSALLVAQLSVEVADQVGAPRGVAVAYFRRRNAVRPEEPESLSQFRPAGHAPCAVHEAELNRPNDTLSPMPLAIDVADR